jgi:uncharacterized lipoprotein YmbA
MFSLSRSMRMHLCALAMLSLACGTTKPSSFYVLTPEQAVQPVQATGISILVGPFEFPDYLDRPQIVRPSAGNELKVSEYDRWAEPLEAGFMRVLTVDLGNTLSGAHVFGFPVDVRWGFDYHVIGRATRFDVDESGEAVLEVGWFVEGDDANLIHGPVRSRFVVQATSARDTEAVTRALSLALSQFAHEIADALTQLSQ